ncbi:MAG: TauD/TfdA family dioxygenase [Nannocystaceae bacterium]|nr:TauD/TfdA family dioxygenase [Nannocystaceae bacterium]
MSRYLDHVELLTGQSSQDVLDGMRSHKARIEQGLSERGAVLLRGYQANDPNTAAESLSVLGGELLDDAFWSTPRSGVTGKTFTATEYPSARTIALHSEMAYMSQWPRFLAFHSIDVAEKGGETSLANLDQISAALGPILEAFATKGVTYRRT